MEVTAAHGFAVAARALGVEAKLVAARDLRIGKFREDLQTTLQLSSLLVAIPSQDKPEGWLFHHPGTHLPFGRIPWWLEGSRGVIAAADAPLIELPLSTPKENAISGTVRLGLSEDGVLHAEWTRRYEGLSTSNMSGREMVDGSGESMGRALCQGGEMKVTHGSFETVEGGAVVLGCEAVEQRVSVDESVAVISVPITGPWLDPLPHVALGQRSKPLRLPRRYMTETQFEITGPEGFIAGRPAENSKLTSPFGTYELRYEVQGTSILVVRRFRLELRDIPLDDSPGGYAAYQAFIEKIRSMELQSVAFSHPTR